MAARLPDGVLNIILSELGQRDIKACFGVCRKWNTIFVPDTWKFLKITEKDKLLALCKLLITPTGEAKDYDYVKRIELPHPLGVLEAVLLIQQKFPHITELDTHFKNLFRREPIEKVAFSRWASLTNLRFSAIFDYGRDCMDAFFKGLLDLPQLEVLTYDAKLRNIPVNFEDLDIIHTNAPQLKILNIYIMIIHLSERDIELLETHDRMYQLEEVNIQLLSDDYRSLAYLASKYPTMKSLDWEYRERSDLEQYYREVPELFSIKEDYFEEAQSLLLGMEEKPFQQLEEFGLTCDESDYAPRLRVLNLLNTLDVPYTSFHIEKINKLHYVPPNNELLETLDQLPSTITGISLNWKSLNNDYKQALQQLGLYDSLSSLTIVSKFLKVELDVLFNTCRNLKSLSLDCRICISDDYLDTDPSFQLDSVVLDGGSFDSSALAYLGRHCLDCKNFSFERSTLLYESLVDTSSVQIDMTWANIKNLKLFNAAIPEDEWTGHYSSSTIRLLSVTQAYPLSHKIKYDNDNDNEPDIELSTSSAAKTEWFFLPKESRYGSTEYNKELSKSQGRSIEEYFLSAEEDRYLDASAFINLYEKTNLPMTSYVKQLRKSGWEEEWKKILEYGYINLTVKSSVNIII
ncbi:hypothetical protein F4703DRAFT_1865705 [Phycomyces blakesleeanus]